MYKNEWINKLNIFFSSNELCFSESSRSRLLFHWRFSISARIRRLKYIKIACKLIIPHREICWYFLLRIINSNIIYVWYKKKYSSEQFLVHCWVIFYLHVYANLHFELFLYSHTLINMRLIMDNRCLPWLRT